LGYLKLGQPATTLSGGEAQRIKLSSELSRVSTGRTLYLMDEPTTGLHFEDIRVLLEVLGRLVDGGNTVVVIEHQMDVIKTADHIIDLGPEGGDWGGELVAEGTPEEVARHPGSFTGEALREVLPEAAPAPARPIGAGDSGRRAGAAASRRRAGAAETGKQAAGASPRKGRKGASGRSSSGTTGARGARNRRSSRGPKG